VEPFHVEQLRRVLAAGFAELELPAGPAALERFEVLALLLDRWSQRINLTGHRGAIQIAERLLLEAAALNQVLPPAETLVDLGSGAGIPGLPLAIFRPHCSVRLVESRERRHHFQRAAIRELGLDNVTALLGRAEELDVQPSSGVIAQAIARPDQALAWMRRWVVDEGWIALATVPGAAPSHPDLQVGRVVRYAAPRGPERAVWVARLRESDPSS
jgi:16S rRNA (guanine(527)-N(7))-methyltransferase RsmG